MGPHDGAQRTQKSGRRYSRITAQGDSRAAPVKNFKGKNLCVVFFPKRWSFAEGVKEFAAQQEKFVAQECGVIVCTADHSWSTWSTSVGLTLMGDMAAASLQKLKDEVCPEQPGPPDATTYDVPTVSLIILDEKSCIRHVMTTSLSPADAVDSALSAAEAMRMYNLPDPNVYRTTTRERTFEKKKFNEFKRRSFYDMQLNTEAGQIKYLGEATLGGQCHVPYMQAMLQSS